MKLIQRLIKSCCWMVASGAVVSSLAASPALSQEIGCKIYAHEPIHSSLHRRGRIFVATESNEPQHALALGYAIASEKVATKGYDFVVVLVTRKIDGTNRNDHNNGTALAVVNFNPGNTPVVSSRLEGDVVRLAVHGTGELAVLYAPRQDVGVGHIMTAYFDTLDEGVTFGCTR